MNEKNPLRKKIEHILVKYPNAYHCEHTIGSMLDLDKEKITAVQKFLYSIKYAKLATSQYDVCSSRNIAHLRYKATDKLIKKCQKQKKLPEKQPEDQVKKEPSSLEEKSMEELLADLENIAKEIGRRIRSIR